MTSHKPLILKMETCPHCHGSGIVEADGYSCPTCGGSGLLPPYAEDEPPDAAVREAVEWFEGFRRCTAENNAIGRKDYIIDHIDTLLRAVQAPRLTPEKVEAVQVAASLLKGKNGDRAWARRKLEAAFPEAFAGEVGRG